MPEESYRESHLQKGAKYHSSFTSRPHLAMTWKLEQRLLARIVNEHFPDGAPTHLDFACGTGRILGFLSPHTGSSTGVDVSASMLQVAHETLTDVEIIETDLTRDDRLGCRGFDLITAFRFFPNAEPDLRRDAFAAIGNSRIQQPSEQKQLDQTPGRCQGGKIRAAGPDAEWGMTRREAYELIHAGGMEIEREYGLSVLPLGDRHMLRPIALTEAVESLMTRSGLFAPLAQNLIYVCRRVDAEL